MKNAIIAGIMLTMVASVAPGRAAELRTETKKYVGSSDFFDVCDDAGIGFGISGACFGLSPSDVGRRVEMIVSDDRYDPVGATYFFDLQGEAVQLYGDVLCGRGQATVPPRAYRLEISTSLVLGATPLECNTPGPGTTGKITITVSDS